MTPVHRIAANDDDLPEGVAVAMYLGRFVVPVACIALGVLIGWAI